jgi:hypothetical protein
LLLILIQDARCCIAWVVYVCAVCELKHIKAALFMATATQSALRGRGLGIQGFRFRTAMYYVHATCTVIPIELYPWGSDYGSFTTPPVFAVLDPETPKRPH